MTYCPRSFDPDCEVLRLPTDGNVIRLWIDEGDVLVKADLGEIFRIDTEKRVIRAN